MESRLTPQKALVYVMDLFGVTGAELSRRTGIDQTDISRYLNERRDFSSRKLQKVILGLSPVQRAVFFTQITEANDEEDIEVERGRYLIGSQR